MQVTKDRNFILVCEEESKVYKFDLNTFVWLGLAGQPLKTNPQVLRNDPDINHANGETIAIKLLRTAVEAKKNSSNTEFTKQCLTFYERILVLGLDVSSFRDIRWNYTEYSEVKFDASFVAYLKNRCNGRLCRDAIDRYQYESLKVKYPELSDDNFDCIVAIIKRTTLEYGEYIAIQVIHKYIYQMSNWRDMAIRHYDKLIAMNMTEWKKDKSFLDAYCRVATEYDVWKNRAMSVRLAETRKPQLAYENDKYIVIVPTTEAEYKDEADMQGNCVYRMYMERVANGRTNIVFIRKKSDVAESLVTCEVTNNFEIEQYLAYRNSRAIGEELAFKEEYEKYLLTLKS